jgi:hypothetical protein
LNSHEDEGVGKEGASASKGESGLKEGVEFGSGIHAGPGRDGFRTSSTHDMPAGMQTTDEVEAVVVGESGHTSSTNIPTAVAVDKEDEQTNDVGGYLGEDGRDTDGGNLKPSSLLLNLPADAALGISVHKQCQQSMLLMSNRQDQGMGEDGDHSRKESGKEGTEFGSEISPGLGGGGVQMRSIYDTTARMQQMTDDVEAVAVGESGHASSTNIPTAIAVGEEDERTNDVSRYLGKDIRGADGSKDGNSDTASTASGIGSAGNAQSGGNGGQTRARYDADITSSSQEFSTGAQQVTEDVEAGNVCECYICASMSGFQPALNLDQPLLQYLAASCSSGCRSEQVFPVYP